MVNNNTVYHFRVQQYSGILRALALKMDTGKSSQNYNAFLSLIFFLSQQTVQTQDDMQLFLS